MLRYGVLCYKYKILLYLCTSIIYRPFGNKKSMKQRQWITVAIITMALTLTSCGTIKKSANTVGATTTPVTTTEKVEASKDFISIAEAIDMVENPEKIASITKKYGYKLKENYEIYRLDKFSKMYYKNCRLAKILTAGKYEDYPKPLQKGVSSYVAFQDGAVIIGVFNQGAYDNLVAQVKAAGFVLDMPGNEDVYKKGNRTIGCNEGLKTVRVQ